MILLDTNNNFNNEQNEELDINRQNRENYENLMKDSATNLDGYWDKNNAFVKLFLIVLALAILVGVGYYIMMYLNSK